MGVTIPKRPEDTVALEDQKTSEGQPPDPEIATMITAKLTDGKLSCASAFDVVKTLDVMPLDVGGTADRIGVRLAKCQLGFFGYPNKQAWDQADFGAMPVPDGLAEAIRAAQNENGNVSCATLWQLAARYNVPRLQIGYVIDQLGIHVTPCQLGAF
jgi:hypothetical protein